MTALIRFTGVGRTFEGGSGDVLAVRDVNLAVEAGEIVSIVGPSGCGKSTLLNMTAGLFAPTAGVAEYRGRPISDINREVGYMTQSDHLLPWRTVAGNIAAPLQIAGWSRARQDARIEELIETVGLAGFARAYPSQLSGGMRKRVSLARLLSYDPATLLMDEPFGALDALLRLRLQSELRALCRRFGKTVLFVTHDLDEAVSLGDRVVVFSERPGTIVEIVDVPLDADRDLMRLRFDARFTATCARIWTLLAPSVEGAAA